MSMIMILIIVMVGGDDRVFLVFWRDLWVVVAVATTATTRQRVGATTPGLYYGHAVPPTLPNSPKRCGSG